MQYETVHDLDPADSAIVKPLNAPLSVVITVIGEQVAFLHAGVKVIRT